MGKRAQQTDWSPTLLQLFDEANQEIQRVTEALETYAEIAVENATQIMEMMAIVTDLLGEFSKELRRKQ